MLPIYRPLLNTIQKNNGKPELEKVNIVGFEQASMGEPVLQSGCS